MADGAPKLAAAAASTVAWAREHALPLWATRGWDPVRGGFVERLREDGTPDMDAPRRVRVQARQIYVYAHAAVLGWYEPARDVAMRGFEWWLKHCRAPGESAGFCHVVSPDGQVTDAKVDAYDQAFGLLALAWMYRLTGDSQIRSMIDAELAFQDRILSDRDFGGWYEGMPASLPRRQNPQMHAFEAMLALFEATQEPAMLSRAEGYLNLLQNKLVDAETGALLEFFDASFKPVDGLEGRLVEPGHHFEWTWLLSSYARLKGAPVPRLADTLYDWASRYGVNSRGVAIDACLKDGQHHSASSRLWPQTEYIKATLARAENGVQGAPENAARAMDMLWRLYMNVLTTGGWIDSLDAAGAEDDRRMPSSTMYHVFCAIAEADRVAKRLA